MSDRFDATSRVTPTRHKDRISYDRRSVYAVLDEAPLCHVGFVVDGQAVVLPQLHARVGDQLYLHGSSGARAMVAARDGGLNLCVTMTLMDGLVLARSAFNHSVNYRSVVIHGLAQEVTDPADKRVALSQFVDAMVPGRSAAVREPSEKELAATTVLRMPLENVSLKTRSGPPADEESDIPLPYWAGVLPLQLITGNAEPSPDLDDSIPTPAHVTHWQEQGWAKPSRYDTEVPQTCGE